MNNDVFGSIDDIDAKLDEEFGEVANEPEETDNDTSTDNVVEEETNEVENGTSEETSEETKKEQEEVTQKEDEGKSDSKKDYAFSNLRAENTSLKKERDGYKADSDYLKELAASYGYDDIAKFQEAIRTSRYQKEAQEKGYDPALYRKTMEQERRIAQLEKEKEEEAIQRKLDRFKAALDKAVDEYGIEEEEICSRLDDAGLDVESVLNIPNPKLLIDGVLKDKIQNNAKQNQIENLQNLKNLAEDKNEQGSVDNKITIDSLLKDDLAEYKKNNIFN